MSKTDDESQQVTEHNFKKKEKPDGPLEVKNHCQCTLFSNIGDRYELRNWTKVF